MYGYHVNVIISSYLHLYIYNSSSYYIIRSWFYMLQLTVIYKFQCNDLYWYIRHFFPKQKIFVTNNANERSACVISLDYFMGHSFCVS
jgi:hypothetical protein